MIHSVRTINELPHRSLSENDKILFSDGDIFSVENWDYKDGICFYILRKILKNGNKGKTHWAITYTTKNGMKAACHRK